MRYRDLIQENTYQDAIDNGIPVTYVTQRGKKVPGYYYNNNFNYLQGSAHKVIPYQKVRDSLIKRKKTIDTSNAREVYKKVINTGFPAALKKGEQLIQGFIDRSKQYFVFFRDGVVQKLPYLKYKRFIELRYGH